MSQKETHFAYLRRIVTSAVAENGFKSRWSTVTTLWPNLSSFSMRYAGYLMEAIPPSGDGKSHMGEVFADIRERIADVDLHKARYLHSGDRPLITAVVEAVWETAPHVACFEVKHPKRAGVTWRPCQGPLSEFLEHPSRSPIACRRADNASTSDIEAVRKAFLQDLFPEDIHPFIVSLSPGLVPAL